LPANTFKLLYIFLIGFDKFILYLWALNQMIVAMDKNEPELKSTQMLKDAILDSELLLSHASEKGLEVNPDNIKAIVNAKKNEQNNTWNSQDEIDFWLAFQTLSKAIQPVSIDSLRASAEPTDKPRTLWERVTFQRRRSRAAKSVKWYQYLALISMIIMLAVQIYSIIGTALMAKITSSNDRMLQIEKRTSELILITSTNQDDRTADLEKTNLDAEHDELSDEVESSIVLLSDWLNFSVNIWSHEIKIINKSLNSADTTQGIQIPLNEDKTIVSDNIAVIQQAKSLIIILNQYFLPLMYGLIGGFAFVLRSLANETKKMIYTPTSNIEFGLRIHLGALAGLVIGFLWGDFQGKSFGLVESLSPLAVAFLAGYSVDFLFRLIDSAIGNVTKKEPAPAEVASKKATDPKQ
jgi:hypothetical protein